MVDMDHILTSKFLYFYLETTSIIYLYISFFQCLLLNVTYCPPAEMDLTKGKSLVSVLSLCMTLSNSKHYSLRSKL
jgi:hypothetical protein